LKYEIFNESFRSLPLATITYDLSALASTNLIRKLTFLFNSSF